MPEMTSVTRSLLAVAVVAAVAPLSVHSAETQWGGFAENATYHRDGVGLSKFRNTVQAEFFKPIETRGDWYGVSLNGVLRATYDGVYDLNNQEFGEDAEYDYLGDNWHEDGGASSVLLSPGVAVPCENDPTLCHNLGGYMDEDANDLRYSDFNDELDAIREFYLEGTTDIGNDQLTVRVGKQQVIWGRTDLFRVLDVINPVDYSRHNIYDELEDIRIPQWMLSAEWRMGANSVFDDMNLQLVWNFDKFRPNNLGTCGQPYRILDAGCFFAAYLQTPGGNIPVIHDVILPKWGLQHSQGGLKWEGVYGDATFSVNALRYFQQLPAIHWRGPDPGTPAADGLFDIHFPRVNLIGGSVDYYHMRTDATWRLETTFTQGEEFARDLNGYKATDVFRYVLGMDKNLIIPELGTYSAFLISAQLFGQNILDHETDMPDAEKNITATFLFKGFYMNNRLSPQVVIAHDTKAAATVYAPSVSYQADDHWSVNVGLSIKEGGKKQFNWAPSALAGEADVPQWEPLARFSNGPIGVANEEDEVQLTVRYGF